MTMSMKICTKYHLPESETIHSYNVELSQLFFHDHQEFQRKRFGKHEIRERKSLAIIRPYLSATRRKHRLPFYKEMSVLCNFKTEESKSLKMPQMFGFEKLLYSM